MDKRALLAEREPGGDGEREAERLDEEDPRAKKRV